MYQHKSEHRLLPSLLAKGRAWLVLNNQFILSHNPLDVSRDGKWAILHGGAQQLLHMAFALLCCTLQEQGERSYEESGKNSLYIM